MVVAIKNPKLVHQEPKKAIIYKSHIKDDKVIPTNITPYEMMFIKNPNKIKPEHRVFIDSADPTKFITYEQLHQDILKIAAGLKRDFNFQPGDVLALCCPNDNEFPAVFHAAVCAGKQTYPFAILLNSSHIL
jgi:acyl-coenzyme A synthetase/AMP-(fatty) acid ligase